MLRMSNSELPALPVCLGELRLRAVYTMAEEGA